MTSNNSTNWATWLHKGAVSSTGPFKVSREGDTWVSKDLPVSSHATSANGKLLVQASLTSDARSQPIQRGTSGTATIQDEAVGGAT